MRLLHGNFPLAKKFSFVIPAKAGIHFDFSPGRAASTLLLRGVRMRNPENSPFFFVFDSDPPRSGLKTSERRNEKAKGVKMDSGFRRNDGQNPKPGGGAGVTSSSMGFFNSPLKGGVIFLSRRSVIYDKSGVPGFFTPHLTRGVGGVPFDEGVGGSRESGLPAKGNIPRRRLSQQPRLTTTEGCPYGAIPSMAMPSFVIPATGHTVPRTGSCACSATGLSTLPFGSIRRYENADGSRGYTERQGGPVHVPGKRCSDYS